MTLSEANWERLISEQQTSGETIDKFCDKRGLSRYTFKKRKYSGGTDAVARKPQIRGDKFRELVQVSAMSLAVKLRNGRVLEIGSGFNESEVQRLIKVVEGC